MSYWYERLTAQDRSFLVFEKDNTHMHLGGITLFEHAPLATVEGGVDIDRIRSYIGSRLHFIPRYRQRLAYVPVEDYPVWVDDDRLNLHYHVRHTSVPRPGDERQLKRLAARIMSAPLDRRRPLWEVWVIEGLEGDRFAMLLKTHHSVVDGVSGVDLMSVLLRPEASHTFEEAPTWRPRAVPSSFDLLRDEVSRRTNMPRAVFDQLQKLLRDPRRAAADLVDELSSTWEFINAGLRRPADTPLNRPIGPYRRFDWHSFDLAQVKAVKNSLGGTVNDVILAAVTGALRRFLSRRMTSVDSLDYRAVVPVNVRRPDELGAPGNHVSAWMLSLPVNEPNVRERFRRIHESTTQLKQSKQAQGIEALTQIAEIMDPVLSLGVRLAARVAPYNLIVTNVPGPQFPLYLLGSRLVEGYPSVPLFEYQGLGVAIFSYDNRLFFGLNADWELVPDLHDLVADLDAAFRELLHAATAQNRRPPVKRVRAAKRPATRARAV
ncbi:MAG TPA: wax ester/triacylglycerol synthase family O-acyltransferase [Candidatus Acidoferrales bacterium]|nr:wax ester/triacylglycerol synthase family O-acyltransferase [Candidatus Acidoferrales bacterium]